MSIQIQELAERYGTAWAAHDLDAIMAMHTEDTVFHLHGGGEASVGLAATRAAFAAAASQWPDIRFVKTRVKIGEGHFVSEYQMNATADGTTKKAIRCKAASIRRDRASKRAPGAPSRAASPDIAGSSDAEMAMPNRLTGSV